MALEAILSSCPRASARLAPLREIRERAHGEPLPAGDFPVAAFATDPLDKAEAWALWRELRAEPRLDGLTALVATADAGVLDAPWEQACADAADAAALGLRAAPLVAPPPTARKLAAWAARDGVKSVLRRFGVDAPGPEVDEDALDDDLAELLWAFDPPSATPASAGLALAAPALVRGAAGAIGWGASMPSRADPRGEQTVYLMNVEPWAGPLVLSWLFPLARWAKLAPLLRGWHEALGFSVVSLGVDTMEAWVARPPSAFDGVVRRLGETVAFCPDYLDEGFARRLLMTIGQGWGFRFDV